MCAHTTLPKHSLGHDKMLGEKKVELIWKEVQSGGFNP
jgi:hypothetical protein